MRLGENPKILLMGHPLLFKEQRQVVVEEILTEDFQHNLAVLKKKQIDTQGVGLAAPQVDWPVRVLSVGISEVNRSRYPGAPDIPFGFWVNPQITQFSSQTCWSWEACLSVPGMRGLDRASRINHPGWI